MHDEFGRIPGVMRCRVVLGLDGKPREIHLVTDTRKPPQYFVRDVQAVALTYYDWTIDRRIVSVAQLEDADAAEVVAASRAALDPPAADAPRPSLRSIAETTSERERLVVVDLAIGSGVHRGEARGPDAAVHRPRLVAEATLRALVELLDVAAQVHSSRVVPAGDHEVALCVLAIEIPRLGEQVLCGSALVRGDEADAVARAVLAAVNRRLAG